MNLALTMLIVLIGIAAYVGAAYLVSLVWFGGDDK